MSSEIFKSLDKNPINKNKISSIFDPHVKDRDMNLVITNESVKNIINIWTDMKLEDICRCIILFTDYIYSLNISKNPILDLPITKYVIEEIFNCNIVPDNETNQVYLIPQSFILKCKKYLKNNLKLKNIIIRSEVYEYLFKYISIGIYYIDKNKDYKEIAASMKGEKNPYEIENIIEKNKIIKVKENILLYRSYISNKNSNINLQECFVKSLIYILITISDWFELTTLTNLEFVLAINILLPNININEGGGTQDKYIDSLMSMIVTHKMHVNDNDTIIKKLNSIFSYLNELDINKSTDTREYNHEMNIYDISDYEKVNNRIRYFCNDI